MHTKLLLLVLILIGITLILVNVNTSVKATAKLEHKTFEKCFKNPNVINQDVASALDERTKTFLEEKAVEYNTTIPNPNTEPAAFGAYHLITKIHVCMVEGGS